MTKEEAVKQMRYGSWAAFVAAALSAIIIAVEASQKPEAPFPISSVSLVILIAVLGYGLKKRSRICGVTLSALLVGSLLWRMIATRSLATSLGSVAITVFVVVGTYSAFRWHALYDQADRKSGSE